MTTDGSSPHQLALDLADMMYVGPKRGRLDDRSAGEASASVARHRPLVVDPPATDRPAERAPAPAEPTPGTSAIATTEPEASRQAEAADPAPDGAAEVTPAATRESRPLRLVADAVDEGTGLDDDVLWSQDAASPHDVVAPAPRRRRGLTVGERRRPWARKRSTPAPAAEVDEAPELEQLHDVGIDVDEAPADVAPIADAPSDPESEAEVAALAPGVGLRLAGSAHGWQQSRARRRLHWQARPTPVKRRRALRGVVVGLVAGALVVVVLAVGMSLAGHVDRDANSSTLVPAAPIAGPSPAPSAAAAASETDRRERAKRAGAAQARREQQRKAERQRERAARKRREARERRESRERAAARQRAAAASAPAPVTSAPAAPGPAPVAAAPAPSSLPSDRAGWTGEFAP